MRLSCLCKEPEIAERRCGMLEDSSVDHGTVLPGRCGYNSALIQKELPLRRICTRNRSARLQE